MFGRVAFNAGTVTHIVYRQATADFNRQTRQQHREPMLAQDAHSRQHRGQLRPIRIDPEADDVHFAMIVASGRFHSGKQAWRPG